MELARGRNIAPLPLIKPHCGLRLPPDRYCLIAANYKLRPASQPKKITKSAIEGRSTIKTQIKGAANTPAIKRQNVSAAPKSQTVTIPKPVFKFSTMPKTVPAKPKSEIKMEVDDGDSSALKRKREEDDFETVG